MIMLDRSGSMAVAQLEAVKYISKSFVEKYFKRQEGQAVKVSTVLFNTEVEDNISKNYREFELFIDSKCKASG